MAGTIDLFTVPDASDSSKQCSVQLLYNDQLKATNLSGVNNTTAAVSVRIVGTDGAGAEDPQKEFALLLPPGGDDQVSIPVTGPKAIQLAVNDRGRIAGFNTYTS